MDVHLNDTGVEGERPLEGLRVLRLKATDVRRERTGIHARLAIGIDDTVLAWSNLNIERDEDRTRLVNKATRQAEAMIPGLLASGATLNQDVDLFCLQVWPQFITTMAPAHITGSLDMGPPAYLAWPYVVKGGGTILFGPPGEGKSFTGQLLAISIDAGLSTLWRCDAPTPTLFINLERSLESVKRRLPHLNLALGLDPDRPLLIQQARGKTLADVAHATERAVEKHKVGCIVLDSISRGGTGDLTENRPVNQVCDLLNQIAPTWVALAHSPRGGDHVYGSIMFEAAADIMVRQQAEPRGNRLGIRLTITKSNDDQRPDPQYLAYEFDEHGFYRVVDARASEFPELASEPGKVSTYQRILAYVTEKVETTPSAISVALGIDLAVVSRTLATEAFERKRVDGRQRFYGLSTRGLENP